MANDVQNAALLEARAVFFVQEVNRGRVILVDTVMDKGETVEGGISLPQGLLLEEAAKRFAESGQARANVVDKAGQPIGSLSMQNTVAAMVTPNSH